MSEDEYIWIVRWKDFQHYRPERDRAPAWIKDYTKQYDDGRFLSLTMYQRGVLGGLRAAFSRSHGRLSADTRQLTRRLHGRVTAAMLTSLNDAGFIEFCSRETLESRLEELYSESSPRARPRARRDLEVEEERSSSLNKTRSEGKPAKNGRAWICPDCLTPFPTEIERDDHYAACQPVETT